MKNLVKNICFFLLAIALLTSCNTEQKNKLVEQVIEELEPPIKNKDAEIEKINKTIKKYLSTYDDFEKGVDLRYDLSSKNYKRKLKERINHAINSSKSELEKLTLNEQLEILGFRKDFTLDQLESLDLREILRIQAKDGITLIRPDSEFKFLSFYNANQACGAIKMSFKNFPLLFDLEGNEWKVDPYGDLLHHKMIEQKYASMQNLSYGDYKKSMLESLEITEDQWIPLSQL